MSKARGHHGRGWDVSFNTTADGFKSVLSSLPRVEFVAAIMKGSSLHRVQICQTSQAKDICSGTYIVYPNLITSLCLDVALLRKEGGGDLKFFGSFVCSGHSCSDESCDKSNDTHDA